MNEEKEKKEKGEERKEQEGNGEKNEKSEEMYRISISKAAERAIGQVVDKVNDGFNAGSVNRSELATWVLIRFAEKFSDNELRDIRAAHFDEVSMLESIYRRAKETGEVPADLKQILQKHLGLDDMRPLKQKKPLQKNVINDDIEA